MNDTKNRKNGHYLKDGELYPSVTTILNIISKPGLFYWGCLKTAEALKADPNLTPQEATRAPLTIRDAAGGIGTTVHSFVEAWKAGNTPSLEGLGNDFVPYAKAFIKFTEEMPFTLLERERSVYSKKHHYAGTLDITATDANKELWVLDVKTSKSVRKEMGLQLVAYAEALKEETGLDYRMAVVHLKPTGGYKFVEFKDSIEVFLAAKRLFDWRQLKMFRESKTV